ncbi:hypothetical protein E0Z10_g4314 [Xylaria hypoxylon]|uniref:Protein kinase domain-containing protein n=1 Tax=Xylaria hypoxylon TaxID=37992 RepID=A0A4Z0YZ57_9PEZI|nr:hypothetical protein E0Z10_g4314 [Xylaria hypoxylon]
MEPHLFPRSPPSPTQSEYQSAIQFFYTVRDNNTFNEAEEIGGRPFVHVDNVTSTLIGHKRGSHSEHGQISRLLEAAYRRFQYRQPLQKSYQIVNRLPIFYTLLDLDIGHEIHEFVEDGISKLPIELSKLKKLLPVKYGNEAERFYKQQWRWCAMKFEWRMSRRAHSHEHIVPITARTKIEPTRDGLPKTDRKASLWVVEIPTIFVDKDIRQKLGSHDDDDLNSISSPAREIDSRYRLVVKRFSEKRKSEFEDEKDIYNTIADKEGIVQCIGWYTHCEKEPDSKTETIYYNLVLELGDQDLYSAFQKENPPITFAEIQIFWKSMFNVADALASIQVQQIGQFTTYLWHGDIKPENILDVRGCFKLADPGEARVKTVPIYSNGEVPKIPVPGGTRSFAAPEKFTYRPERLVEPEVTQGSDIWSLGCVFSIAATYVVLGKEGVKQYRLLRQSAIEVLGIGVGDPFHDKEQVLKVVTDWHKYLRNTIRKDDCYTAKILDLVDSRMLIIPGEQRITGATLSEKLKRIDEEATQSTDEVPFYIANFIDKATQVSKGGISELEDVPRTISNSGTELFLEELLYPSRRSEGRPIARLTQPDREDLRGIGMGLDPSLLPAVPERVSGFFTDAQRAMTSLARVPPDAPTKPPEDPPTTFWEVEADILECYSKHNYFNHHFNKRLSVYGKPLGGKEDQLEKHFRNRDLVYLVDNASSMKIFWRHATYVLRVLVMRSLGYDDNGMELRFTDELDEKWRLRPKKRQSTDDFLKKMSDADPNKRRNNMSKTDMSASLSLILEDHLRKNSDGSRLKRHLTILVLTDGLWEKNKEMDVDNYLVTFIKRIPEENWKPETPPEASIPSNKPPSRPRPISIQFIRFGYHPNAIVRLDRLDNHLKDRPELLGTSIPDIIDTEDANMDVYKMFLGSFIEDFDNKAIQGATVVSSASGRSVTSPTNDLETSGMYLGEHETVQTPTPMSSGPFSPPEVRRQHSVPGRPHYPWTIPPQQTYPLSRVPRMPGEPSLIIPELGQGLPVHHHRHGSGEHTASPRGSGAYGQYTRPRGESQGQQSMSSSPLSRIPPSWDH